MSNDRRVSPSGGASFLTPVTCGQKPLPDLSESRRALREVIGLARQWRPFPMGARVLPPDRIQRVHVGLAPGGRFSKKFAGIQFGCGIGFIIAGLGRTYVHRCHWPKTPDSAAGGKESITM